MPESYEQKAQRIQTLLEKIQDDATPLAETIRLYAQAADLIADCREMLDNAKLQIEEIDAKLMQNVPPQEE